MDLLLLVSAGVSLSHFDAVSMGSSVEDVRSSWLAVLCVFLVRASAEKWAPGCLQILH